MPTIWYSTFISLLSSASYASVPLCSSHMHIGLATLLNLAVQFSVFVLCCYSFSQYLSLIPLMFHNPVFVNEFPGTILNPSFSPWTFTSPNCYVSIVDHGLIKRYHWSLISMLSCSSWSNLGIQVSDNQFDVMIRTIVKCFWKLIVKVIFICLFGLFCWCID